MLFCLGEGATKSSGAGYHKKNQIFNIDVTEKEFTDAKNSLPLKLPLTQWIEEKIMTKEEKKENPEYKSTGGFLKVLEYKVAWRKFWEEMSKSARQKFLDLSHFDSKIFLEITGIDVDLPRKETIRIGALEFDKEEVENRLKDLKPIK